MSMTCHVKIQKFMPKDNNDMMQCGTCSKSSLFALRQETNNFSKCFKVQDIYSFLYEVQI
jgi:hypothetical protein